MISKFGRLCFRCPIVIISTISSPFNHSSERYVHSRDTKLHPDYTCGCAFLWKFFCSFFLPRVIPRKFFFSLALGDFNMQFDTLHLTFRFFLSFLSFFVRLCSIRSPVRVKKKGFRVFTLALNINYMSRTKKADCLISKRIN